MPEGIWPFWPSIAAFVLAAAVIGVAGVLITARAERLAELTGLGQAIVGAVFIGASTSLSGLTTSITAALDGAPQLAIGNAIGGIAAQTTFLAIADIAYRRANLEHAAASQANLMQGSLLNVLLAIPLVAMFGPPVSVLGVHPASLALLGAYYYGIRMVAHANEEPMWYPRRTSETQPHERVGKAGRRESVLRLWLVFAALAAAVAFGGWVIARSAISIAQQAGISESVMGTLFTAVSTSLPELVIAVAAVRRGALTLAVGDVIGGNSFDVLFMAVADIAYRGGSIYHHVGGAQALWISLTILLTSILLLGLLRRERHGIANIGFESFFVLLLYGGAVVLLF